MTTDRRLYDMDLGRRDHTRWLGSSRYAGGGPPPPLTLPTANLIAAWDARLGVTNVSGACSAWADQSGNGKDATQSTAGSRPAISTADGYASLLFDGTADTLITPSITATTGVKTIYAVTKLNAVPTTYRTVFSPGGTLFGIVPSVGNYGIYETADRSSGITSTTSRTRLEYEILYTGGTTRTRVNGTAGPSHLWLGTGAIGSGSIGAFNGGTNHFWNGHIFFLAIYAAARSTAVTDYIFQEFGV